MEKIIIIGAGLAGIGAAYRFHCNQIQVSVYEKNSYPGGSAACSNKDGFTFSNAPHIFGINMEKFSAILSDFSNSNIEPIHSYTSNYWKGYWIEDPILFNLSALPKDLIVKIITDFLKAGQEKTELGNSFKDRLYTLYGKTFTDIFAASYTEKFKTTSLDNIDYTDVDQKFYCPTFNEILTGAIADETENSHHTTILHPLPTAGFMNFFNNTSFIDLNLEHQVRLIDTKQKIIGFNSGETEKYDYLISTMPLPELINCMTGVPNKIRLAAENLAYTNCLVINIAVNRKHLSKTYQTYFFDRSIIFSRLTFPGILSPNNSPENYESIQAEIYFSEKYKPLHLPPENFIEPTVAGLIRCGIVRAEDGIMYKEAKWIQFAGIIYDFDRKSNLSAVHNYLNETDIKYCGRYGDWENKMTDASFTSGENAAQEIIDRITFNKTNEYRVSD